MKGRNPLVGTLGCLVIGMMGMAAWSPRPYGAESVGGVEDVDATPSLIREIQFMLLRLGIDPGPIDGVVGPQTIRAFHKFQEQSGLPVADLANGGRISVSLLARLRGEASRVMFGNEKKPEAPPPIAVQPAAPPPSPRRSSVACSLSLVSWSLFFKPYGCSWFIPFSPGHRPFLFPFARVVSRFFSRRHA